jgi:hypothetical protein
VRDSVAAGVHVCGVEIKRFPSRDAVCVHAYEYAAVHCIFLPGGVCADFQSPAINALKNFHIFLSVGLHPQVLPEGLQQVRVLVARVGGVVDC